MGGGGSVPVRRPSTADIDINNANTAEKIQVVHDHTPFTEENERHLARRISQLHFQGHKLDGYGDLITSQVNLVVNDDDNYFNISCVRIDGEKTTEGASRGGLQVSPTGKHFLSFSEVPILEIKDLCPRKTRYPTKHIELDISLVAIQYGVADSILILPENPKEEVDFYVKLLNLNLEDTYEFEGSMDGQMTIIPFPSPFTVRQVLTCYLDLMAKPKKEVLNSMRNYIANEAERTWLDQFLSNPDDLLHSGIRYSKIFAENIPSINLTLNELIKFLPIMRPRTYTCASSPLVSPNSIHLCASIHHYDMPNGNIWYGLCSSYLKGLNKGSMIKILHKKNGFELPSLTTPVILIGIGSGIAPLRSIIQHRAALAEQNNILLNYVKTILLYECNDPEEDFLYYDEICEANRNRSITTCHVAFSQRNGTFRSIQDLLSNQKIKSLISDSMDIEGARIYCSGSKELVRSVEHSIVQLVMEKDNITQQEAIEILQGANRLYSSKIYSPGFN